MHIVFHPLKIGCRAELEALLAIYHHAFPAWERQSDSILQENIQSGFSKAYVAKDERQLIFFLNFYPIPQSRVVFLDYAAAHPTYRGRGVTQCFFTQAFSFFEGDAILLGQQEDPAFGDNREERRKRIAYFQDMGFQYLKGVPYLLPDHSGGTRITPMVLCVMAREPLTTLSGSLIRRAIIFIFTQVYRRGMDDALLARNLRSVPDVIEVDSAAVEESPCRHAG